MTKKAINIKDPHSKPKGYWENDPVIPYMWALGVFQALVYAWATYEVFWNSPIG